MWTWSLPVWISLTECSVNNIVSPSSPWNVIYSYSVKSQARFECLRIWGGRLHKFLTFLNIPWTLAQHNLTHVYLVILFLDFSLVESSLSCLGRLFWNPSHDMLKDFSMENVYKWYTRDFLRQLILELETDTLKVQSQGKQILNWNNAYFAPSTHSEFWKRKENILKSSIRQLKASALNIWVPTKTCSCCVFLTSHNPYPL